MNHEWILCIDFEWANETKSYSCKIHVGKLKTAAYECSISSRNSEPNVTRKPGLMNVKKTFFPFFISSSLAHRIYDDLVVNGKGAEHIVNKQPSHSFVFILHWIWCVKAKIRSHLNVNLFLCIIRMCWIEEKEKGKRWVLHRSHVHCTYIEFGSVLLHNSLSRSLSIVFEGGRNAFEFDTDGQFSHQWHGCICVCCYRFSATDTKFTKYNLQISSEYAF